jgi:hypothetical protein
MKGIDAAMVERVRLEPTMEEIVVALRETRRGAVWAPPPLTVVGGQSRGNWASRAVLRGDRGGAGRGRGTEDSPQDGGGSTDIADLRDGEIERLLTENAHLNERVMFLLKLVEREQVASAEFAAGHAANETDPGVILRDVRAALEAELRPVLLVLLRLLEKQRADPAGMGVRLVEPEAASLEPPSDPIFDVGKRDAEDAPPLRQKAIAAAGLIQAQPNLRQRMVGVDRCAALLISFGQGRQLRTSVAWWRRRVGWPA